MKKTREKNFIIGFINRMIPSMIAGQLVGTICTVIDTALAGRFLGDQAMAAEGMGTPIFLFIAALSSVMAAGNANICSNLSGKGEAKEISRVFSMSIFVSVTFSICVTALILLFLDPICVMLGLTKGTDLFFLSKKYIAGYVLMMPAAALVMVMPRMLQLEGDNKTSLVALFLLFISDMVLDIINIFVVHGGVFGMALATTISFYLASAVIVIAFVRKKHIVKFSFRKMGFEYFLKVLSFGTPALVNSLCIGLVSGCVNKSFLINGSESYVAACTVVVRVGDLFLGCGLAMCELVSMIAGVVNGEEDRKGLAQIIKFSVRKMSGIYFVLIIVALLLANILVLPFTSNSETISMAAFGLRIFSLQLVFHGIFECFIGYYRGIQRFMLGNLMLILMTIFSAAASFGLPQLVGVNGIWFSYAIAKGLSVLAVLVISVIHSHKTPFKAENLLMKPVDFGIPQDNYIEQSIYSMKELTDYCELVTEFVRGHGGDSRQAFFLPLCIEEIGRNVIEYGFDGEDHEMAIKVIYKDGRFGIRVRDDCKSFNPEDFYRIHKGDDKIENFGIRLVFNLAEDVSYINTLNLNNLLVKL